MMQKFENLRADDYAQKASPWALNAARENLYGYNKEVFGGKKNSDAEKFLPGLSLDDKSEGDTTGKKRTGGGDKDQGKPEKGQDLNACENDKEGEPKDSEPAESDFEQDRESEEGHDHDQDQDQDRDQEQDGEGDEHSSEEDEGRTRAA